MISRKTDYGRLSLECKCADSEKMILLYRTTSQQFDTADHKTIFRELAREEIIENGNWFSYCQEKRPTFDI